MGAHGAPDILQLYSMGKTHNSDHNKIKQIFVWVHMSDYVYIYTNQFAHKVTLKKTKIFCNFRWSHKKIGLAVNIEKMGKVLLLIKATSSDKKFSRKQSISLITSY